VSAGPYGLAVMSFVTLPKAAPFTDEDIEALNRVVGTATPVQRAWLAGFLAGVEQTQPSVQTAIAPQAAEPLTILYATESGNSEKLANDAAKVARKLGFKPSVVDMADLEIATLAKAKNLIVIAATWGEGEPPARATRVYNELMSDAAPKLDGVKFGVLALGDTAYADFCGIGKKIDDRLAALGGKRVADRVDCDLDFEKPADEWIGKALKTLAPAEGARGTVIAVDFAARQTAAPDLGPVEAEVSEWIDLNSSRSEKETVHLELSFDGAAPAYKPGDSLDIYPENDPAYVDSLLKTAGLSSDDTLRTEFLKSRDVTTLSLKTVENYASATGHQYVKQLLESGEGRKWIEGRQLIDLIEQFPISLSAEQLRGFTRPLAPRAYSIASSRREVGDEAHLLVSTVRYNSFGRERLGVASGFVGERLKKGSRVKVKVKPNKHFALPGQDTDIIMVGPGTGVAPFRSFVQERRGSGAKGRNWLFFGDRSFTHDFLYQLEWQDALKDGSLARMDVAFSRDTPDKIYVQNKLWEKRRDVVDWLENGAHFYVCGDAKSMAKDVRSTLSRAYADVKGISPEIAEQALQKLDREHRYLQDVY
jgi:sulfite reductase (NADPH) flavoprotein alpha-component